jgi:GrpB-like predicted nucleotidyltransferase (UPF0157 family)
MTGKENIRLIGAATVLSASGEESDDAVIAFYRPLIPKLCSEVSHDAAITRLMGFRARMDAGEEYRFLGIEAPGAEKVPEGMIALDLSDASLTVTTPGRPGMTHPIQLSWREVTPLGPIGEFFAPAPLTHSHPDGKESLRSFSLTVHSPVDVNRPIPESDAIGLSEPDPAWLGEFHRMKRQLQANFPEAVGRIEHYGSTAIPGVPAKPTIDILVETPSFDVARRVLVPGLADPEWEFWVYADHMIFIKRGEFSGPRTHHVHVAPAGHRLWEGLVFRDYLAANPDAAREYAVLKRELSARYQTDREAYTRAKTEFIRGILNRAESW